MIRIVVTALVATLLLACQPGGSSAPAEAVDDVARVPLVGEEAPAAKPTHPQLIVTTLDGTEYDLAARRGKWVVVNFWATWCNPCLKEMPELSALAAMREDIEVLGLAYEEIEPAEMQEFLQKHPVVYPVAIIDTYAPPADFDEPPGLPMTYLIAPEGRVAQKILGPVTATDIEQAIAAGVEDPADSPPQVSEAS